MSWCVREFGWASSKGAHPDAVAWTIPAHDPGEMAGVNLALIAWEFPRLCRGGSRSLTYTAVGHPGNLQWLTHENACGAARPSINLKQSTGMANTVRCFHLRSLWVGYLGEAAPSWELLGLTG